MTTFRHHQAVAVLIGTDCEYHRATLTPESIRVMQGRYGRVMDADQAEAWIGPPADTRHTVAVRFAFPAGRTAGAAGRVWGGWFAPHEVLERFDDEAEGTVRAGREGQG